MEFHLLLSVFGSQRWNIADSVVDGRAPDKYRLQPCQALTGSDWIPTRFEVAFN